MIHETSTRFVGWCPVCQHDVKVRSRALVHHGYKRPGIGFIVGDCPGVGHEPYELGTGAAVAYLNDHVTPQVVKVRHNLQVLEAGPPWLYFENFDVATRRLIRNPQTREPEMIRLTRAEAEDRAAQLPGYDSDRYSWEKRLRIAIANAQSRLEFVESEEVRITGLIDSWEPRPLRTIEEEIQRQEQSRSERESTRTAAKNRKISDEVSKIQKRIDAAVRNKNSATLADIYVSQKLRVLSGYRMSLEDTRALLERDRVWQAFGLLTRDGYLSTKDAEDILDDMTWGKKVPTTRPGLRYDRGPRAWPAELGGGTAKTRDG